MKFGIEKCIIGIKKKKGKRITKEIIEMLKLEILRKLGKKSTCVYWKCTPPTKEKNNKKIKLKEATLNYF